MAFKRPESFARWLTLLVFTVAWLDPALAGREKDMSRGHHLDALIRDTLPFLVDDDLNARIREVGLRLVAASGNPHSYEFRFYIVNDSDPNAFAMPGGYVYITTGLLKMIESEDELAAVLAHEIAHVNKRHPMKTGMSNRARTFWTIALSLGGQVAGEYLGQVVGQAVASKLLAEQAATLVSTVTFIATSQIGESALRRIYRGYEDKFEFKADELALRYSSQAEYNPQALAEVLDRILQNSEVDAPGLIVARLHCSRETLLKRRQTIGRTLNRFSRGSKNAH